jgi:hypothetical protein
MSEYKSLFVTSGISLLISTAVVLANNYYLYRHACKKTQSESSDKCCGSKCDSSNCQTEEKSN